MPSSTLNGDEFEGSVKVKLGAMVLTYRGTARIVERDEAAHRAVIEAAAKESRGAGTAKANVIASLHARGIRPRSRSSPSCTSPVSRPSSVAASWQTSPSG
ncbi:hypothetical protein [Blastococcus brunescens]|uniref:Uncharacterized protein n=1 Tax=Blastococcus brunescens TaxID=1564165 RepID=A0ABZ1AYG5_9ACTN|nr:hypothetical protein [Blastococcus sp. BMG 8361]WRL63613.1 hypothetical protein U6N30_28720 [Blastococcus sp. BMG 8361]